ncbi:MFS transporter [Acuticoccus sp. I52.16.1]|uniref:MFS transporter n=1 Tax=Acuticoccus sp. I52.16.1 TaxID=2928472 RepID=UPI001FD3A5F9|nr:MFS transporter [Acuticoccus sp. I52.16.1]UOM33703.1 MFS transporter [Acuticoccus sp. I52.16.1]
MQANDRLARRNALVLALAQAMGGALTSITISLGGLVGVSLLGATTQIATLAVSMMIVGTACGTIPAAMLMGRIGRRAGFMVGALISSAGGFVAFAAIMNDSFPLYCVGTFVGGFSFAFVQQYRFAAADGASDRFKPRAISFVLAGGLLAGIIGPQTVIATRDLFAPTAFAGAYLAQGLLAIVSLGLLAFYRGPVQAPRSVQAAAGRPMRQILAEPRVQLAILVALVSYGVMSLMMTAAPLAMLACGFDTDAAATGIQWHVIAMFAPSFFTGSLIARFGAEPIATIGLVLLAFAGGTALLGIDLGNFYVALILLGLGWNFGFIGGTAMLTQAQRPEERARTQAANDFIVFGMVAVASLSSGALFQTAGWAPINWVLLGLVACPLIVLGIGAALSQSRRSDKLA